MIPVWNLIINTLTQLDMPLTNKPKILCCVTEDNQGAYLLATNQQLLVRTKYFCVKYHLFWHFVYHPECNPDGWLIVEKCVTDLMNADYLTKGLVRVKFQGNRFQTQGWWWNTTSSHYIFTYLQSIGKWWSTICEEES